MRTHGAGADDHVTKPNARLERLVTMAATKVFETSELLELICGNATPSALIPVLYASRSGFHAAMPVLWNVVDGLVHLLTLIPGVSVAQYDGFDYDRIVGFSNIIPGRTNLI
jgi:hypothetical protein